MHESICPGPHLQRTRFSGTCRDPLRTTGVVYSFEHGTLLLATTHLVVRGGYPHLPFHDALSFRSLSTRVCHLTACLYHSSRHSIRLLPLALRHLHLHILLEKHGATYPNCAGILEIPQQCSAGYVSPAWALFASRYIRPDENTLLSSLLSVRYPV
jgi:hypothetical protein